MTTTPGPAEPSTIDGADDGSTPPGSPPADVDAGADGPTPDGTTTSPPGSHRARWTAGVVGVVLIGLIALFAMGPGNDDAARSDLLGMRVPRVAGETLDGGSYDIDDARGKWVVVNFFATWCPGCILEHPELVEFSHWGAETGRAEVVAVVFNDPAENVAAFFAQNGGDWPVLDEPSLPVAFQVSQIPESFLVSPSGQVVLHVAGEVEAQGLIDAIDSFEEGS